MVVGTQHERQGEALSDAVMECPQLPFSHGMLGVAMGAAREAGVEIRRMFYEGSEIRDKGVGELVTSADLLAERMIVSRIREVFPDHAILAEENVKTIDLAEHLWIVDPIDGTNNFAHRIPHFAVSIGYYYRGVAQVGVVLNPMVPDWYVAVRGEGAWFNGARVRVNDEERLDQSLIGIGFYYDRGAMMETTLMAVRDMFYRNIHGVRRFGTASLDLGQVGRGLFGVYFEYRLHPWDHAAGRLFVEEAGGEVSTCLGQAIPLDRPVSFLASNGKLHGAALEVVRPHWERYLRDHAHGVE